MTRVAILGATGAVGSHAAAACSRSAPSRSTSCACWRRERSAGSRAQLRAAASSTVQAVGPEAASTASTSRSSRPAPRARASGRRRPSRAGAVVVDNSSAFRMDDGVPLVVADVNPHAARGARGPDRQPELLDDAADARAGSRCIAARRSSTSRSRPTSRSRAPARRRSTRCARESAAVLAGEEPSAGRVPAPHRVQRAAVRGRALGRRRLHRRGAQARQRVAQDPRAARPARERDLRARAGRELALRGRLGAHARADLARRGARRCWPPRTASPSSTTRRPTPIRRRSTRTATTACSSAASAATSATRTRSRSGSSPTTCARARPRTPCRSPSCSCATACSAPPRPDPRARRGRRRGLRRPRLRRRPGARRRRRHGLRGARRASAAASGRRPCPTGRASSAAASSSRPATTTCAGARPSTACALAAHGFEFAAREVRSDGRLAADAAARGRARARRVGRRARQRGGGPARRPTRCTRSARAARAAARSTRRLEGTYTVELDRVSAAWLASAELRAGERPVRASPRPAWPAATTRSPRRSRTSSATACACGCAVRALREDGDARRDRRRRTSRSATSARCWPCRCRSRWRSCRRCASARATRAWCSAWRASCTCRSRSPPSPRPCRGSRRRSGRGRRAARTAAPATFASSFAGGAHAHETLEIAARRRALAGGPARAAARARARRRGGPDALGGRRRTAGGSYACHPPGWSRGDDEEIAAPCGRVHLAGEHTAAEFCGTLEGALRSGARAAAEVVAERGADTRLRIDLCPICDLHWWLADGSREARSTVRPVGRATGRANGTGSQLLGAVVVPFRRDITLGRGGEPDRHAVSRHGPVATRARGAGAGRR